jgi:hypothetical protein
LAEGQTPVLSLFQKFPHQIIYHVTFKHVAGAVQCLFAGIRVGARGIVTSEFIAGLHRTFWLSFIISIVAALVSLMRGPGKPRYE